MAIGARRNMSVQTEVNEWRYELTGSTSSGGKISMGVSPLGAVVLLRLGLQSRAPMYIDQCQSDMLMMVVDDQNESLNGVKAVHRRG